MACAPDAPSVFDVEARRERGIYLWTVPQHDGHLVYYVGKQGEAFRSGFWNTTRTCCVYVSRLLTGGVARGEKICLWPGHYDPADRKSATECIAQYSKLCAPIRQLTNLYRFFLAPLSCQERIRKRVEPRFGGSSMPHRHSGRVSGSWIHYYSRREDEEPIGCTITCPVL